MIITICASIDFTPQILEIKNNLEKMGHQVNIPYPTQKIMEGELSFEDYLADKEKFGDIMFRNSQGADTIRRYWNYIKDSEAILVLNLNKKGQEGYIGGSALMEMGFAYGHQKKIYLYNPIPAKSERIHYVDEITDMKPIVINGDLNSIKI